LWFVLTFKFVLLTELANIALALLVAHPLSRVVPTAFIFLLPYVSDPDQSKVKPLAESHEKSDLAVSVSIAAATLLIYPSIAFSLTIILFLLMLVLYRWLHIQLGGFTGDTLGATQQIAELVVYMVIVVTIG